MRQPKVFVIHENAEWLPPLRQSFAALGTPYEEWFLDQLVLDLRSAPPEGVFFSRMSASNYTRGHHHATHSTDAVLRWLEWHGRRVINGSSVLRLEMSKAAQRLALIPFILKPNQGGKGFGVRLFGSLGELDRALQGDDLPQAIDDVWLVQERIETADDFITRVEFIGGRFHYAVRVFGGGSFELCPGDVCEVKLDDFCPADANERRQISAAGPRFEIDLGFADPLISRLEDFLADNAIEIAGVEFIRSRDSRPVIYDLNTNTNYNGGAEASAGVKGGMLRIAEFLSAELRELYGAEALPASA